jgi:large subunit ribosomal protein L24
MKPESKAISINIRRGDVVKMMTGRDRGKTGRVLSVDRAKNRVTVEHTNIIKRHTRANPGKNIKGGIIDKEAAVHISNVMLVCPGCGKSSRMGRSVTPSGSSVRVCRRCGATLPE